ncbi:hypothetical protein O6H91_04G124500 [Diphasiastrum complanatum]|uniref:Uncharacterized protein n=2 Tax=Diphasiastrum complanatum TaxID=34168 RepID=A0ACC2E222_DIPCM|nr:hypothetical protein O6H91_04G124500 [Diphasiastrum complanatum]KAJ7560327.1 hypothetical protein O6H91_04G124500 [Diphasiastrum complanatum]
MMSHSQREEACRSEFWRRELVLVDLEDHKCTCVRVTDRTNEPASVSYRCHCFVSAPAVESTSLNMLPRVYSDQTPGSAKHLLRQKMIKYSGRTFQETKRNQRSRKAFYKMRKFMKPGALAQMRDIRKVARAPCTTIGRKRIIGADNEVESDKGSPDSRDLLALSPLMTPESSVQEFGPACPQRKKLLAPRTPMTHLTTAAALDCEAGQAEVNSVLETIPLDILVRIMCYLHHDQLKPVFHVCKRFRQAVVMARQIHFNYKTPSRERQESLSLITPKPDQQWPFLSLVGQPAPPNAPRHSSKPPQARIPLVEMRRITATLFRGSASQIPPRPPRMAIRSLTSHRVLFNEEELCQAVAQNSL